MKPGTRFIAKLTEDSELKTCVVMDDGNVRVIDETTSVTVAVEDLVESSITDVTEPPEGIE